VDLGIKLLTYKWISEDEEQANTNTDHRHSIKKKAIKIADAIATRPKVSSMKNSSEVRLLPN